MKHSAACLLICAFLMGCGSDGNPLGGSTSAAVDTGDTTTDPGTGTDDPVVEADDPVTVPDGILSDVTSVTFDATAGTLVVEGLTLDNVPVETTYNRNAALDQNGFLAFTIQADPLDRHVTAYGGETGSVRAGVVSSPGPRNRNFKGAFFDRDGDYTPPDVTATTGQVSYSGSYVGLTNLGELGSDLLSTTVTPTILQPTQALIVSGDVFMNADFADNSVEGNVFNRILQDTDLNTLNNLPSLVLIVTDIEENGTFSGSVEYDIDDPLSNTDAFIAVGTYAGVFGSTDANDVAGAIDLNEFDGSGNPLTLENELESGVFILNNCDTLPGDPVCALIP